MTTYRIDDIIPGHEELTFDSDRPDITHTYVIRVDGQTEQVIGLGFTTTERATSAMWSQLKKYDRKGIAASGRVRRIEQVTA